MVQVFQGPDPGFRMGPGFSKPRSRVRVQGLGQGFRSNPFLIILLRFIFKNLYPLDQHNELIDSLQNTA